MDGTVAELDSNKTEYISKRQNLIALCNAINNTIICLGLLYAR